MDSTGVMPQPTGQLDRTSTIEKPARSSCAWHAFFRYCFVRPIADAV
jgi:hypothetical protein